MEGTHTNEGRFIGDVARLLGVSQRMVRYYEQLGLVKSERLPGGFRIFHDAQIDRLKTALSLKDIGIPLEEIGRLFQLKQDGARVKETAPEVLPYLKAKLASLKEMVAKHNSWIKELKNIIDLIEGCHDCYKSYDKAICKECVDDKTHHRIPSLMKTVL